MTAPDGLVTVRLLAIPVSLRARSMQHGEELVREMALISQPTHDADHRSLPERLVQLANEVRTTYGALIAKADEQFEAAVARGDQVLDELAYQVPPTFGDFARHLIEILAEADAYCRAGQHLLTLATPPDVDAYRRWALSEFERQLAGEPPTPWPEFAATNG